MERSAGFCAAAAGSAAAISASGIFCGQALSQECAQDAHAAFFIAAAAPERFSKRILRTIAAGSAPSPQAAVQGAS
ncbi:MAG: hypothetical protein ACLVF7_07340 [Ruminococcus sp.]